MQVAFPVQAHEGRARAYVIEVDIILVFVDSIKLFPGLTVREHDIAGGDRDGAHQIPSARIVADASSSVSGWEEVTGGDDWAVEAVAGVVRLIPLEAQVSKCAVSYRLTSCVAANVVIARRAAFDKLFLRVAYEAAASDPEMNVAIILRRQVEQHS